MPGYRCGCNKREGHVVGCPMRGKRNQGVPGLTPPGGWESEVATCDSAQEELQPALAADEDSWHAPGKPESAPDRPVVSPDD
ncbi:MAG: hypothetical protein BWY19_00727 [bacterium ADurb.Bin212]|nr:MAG: hypothetical protein BWY19_00727 [bacterium ADurb.Bin212]